MTVHVVIAVRDSAVAAYDRPWFAPTTAAAVRAFTDEVNRDGCPMKSHPEDYSLWQLCWYDDEKGEFLSAELKQLVRAQDVLAQ